MPRSLLCACLLLALPAGVACAREAGEQADPKNADLKARTFLTLDTGGHTAPVFQAVFTPDGKELISVSLDKTIRFWDVETGRSLRVLRPPIGPGHQGELNTVALSPDGKLLAVAGFGFLQKDKHPSPIYLIDRESGVLSKVLPGHSRVVLALAFSADGKRLASGGEDRRILIWDVAGARVVKSLEGHGGPITSLAFSPDGKKLVSAGSPPHVGRVTPERVAWLWSVETGKVLTRLEGVHDRVVRRVAWSPDGRRIATGSQADPGDNAVALWDARGKFLKRIPYVPNRRMGCTSLAFTPDSKNLVVSLRDGFYISAGVYSLSGGEPRLFIRLGNYLKGEIPAGAAVVSPDGSRVAIINDRHHRIALYNRADGKYLRTLGGTGRQPVLVSWVRTGKPAQRLIAWRTQLVGQNYKAWEPMGEGLFTRAFRLDALAFAPAPRGKDERYVRARFGEGPLILWGAGGREVLLRRGEKEVARLQPRFGDSWTTAPAVSFLNAKQAVIANLSGMWLFGTGPKDRGKLLRQFSGPNGAVLSVAPSPDQGRYLLASAEDQVIRVWDPRRPRPLLSLFVAGGEWIAWTEEGYYAATPVAETFMGWTVNDGQDRLASFYPAERFRKQLYRPDVIRLVLEKGSVAAAVKAADLALRAKNLPVPRGARSPEQLLPPGVRLAITDRSQLEELRRITVRVTARQRCPEQPIKSLRLLVDGRSLPDLQARIEFEDGKEKAEHVQPWAVELPPGKHRLSVLAFARDDTPSFSNELLVWTPLPKEERPRLHHLAVGVSKYDDKNLKLDYAAKDARDLAEAFTRAVEQGALYRGINSKRLLNEKASCQAVLAAIKAVRRQAQPNDLFVLSFAGHGHREEGEFYLLTHEANFENAKEKALSGKALRKRLEDFPCPVLMLLDACHSGQFPARRPGTDEAARTLSAVDVRVAVMCAALGHEDALEDKGNGLFTSAVIRALKHDSAAFYDKLTGELNVYHLQAFVYQEVARASEAKGKQQTPYLKMPLAQPAFIITQFQTQR
jgi:WD40 repeat protein